MAIALPPPPVPQQGSLTELQAEAAQQQPFLIDYQGVHLRIFGSRLVPEQRLRQGIEAAASLSDAVRSVGYSYYYSGYPAALVTYAAERPAGAAGNPTPGVTSGPTVYIRVIPARVGQVAGPPRLQSFFRDLPQHQPLTDAQLETDRALADAVASRGGEQYKPAFVPTAPDAVTLDLGQAQPGGRQTSAAASFNNYGNRYAGPYLANLGLRHSFSTGDELTLTGTTAVRMLGLGGDHAGAYHGADGGWSRVTRFGTFGLEGSYADFEEASAGVSFKGKLHELAASWQYLLYSSFRQRLSVQGRLLHDHEALGEPSQTAAVNCTVLNTLLAELGLQTCQTVQSGGDAFSENYSSAELSVAYQWRTLEGEHRTELQAGALLRKGLSGGIGAGSNADLSYLLWQPSLSLRYGLSPHWSMLLSGNAQFSDGVLPQQQQFVIGGPLSLHAFLTGAGVGDRGEAASLATEWRGDSDSLSERLGLRPRLFVEYAAATHRQSALGEPSGTVRLADVGAAADLQPWPWLITSISVGRPIAEHGGQDSPDQLQTRFVFFQLALKY